MNEERVNDPAEIPDGRELEPIEEGTHYCENTKTVLLFPKSACSCGPEESEQARPVAWPSPLLHKTKLDVPFDELETK